MKKFFLGLVAGAAAVYVASKLIDEDSREEIYDRFNKVKGDAEYQFRKGKRKAMRAGIRAKHDFMAGKEKAGQYAEDIVDRVTGEYNDLDSKIKENINRKG